MDYAHLMRWSTLLIPTLRDESSDPLTAAQRLLYRAGYARRIGADEIYLPLAARCFANMRRLALKELAAIGAQELILPSGRDAVALADREIRSPKQLPQIWMHPDGDSVYWFAPGDGCFDLLADSLRKILSQCDLDAIQAGSKQEGELAFFAQTTSGNGIPVLFCGSCGYRSKAVNARTEPTSPSVPDSDAETGPEPFCTPGRKTIADVAEFTGLPASTQMKSLVFVADDVLTLALVRGDHQLSEPKFRRFTGVRNIRTAREEEIIAAFGAEPGSLGPVGLPRVPIIADLALSGRRNMIAGANRTGYHLRNVTPGRDFQPVFADIRQAAPGDRCTRCHAELAAEQRDELARIESRAPENMNGPGTTRSQGEMNLSFSGLLHAIAETHRDSGGLCLSALVAPFHLVITPVNNSDPALRAAAESIESECVRHGLAVLYDDRDERPGVKFKDADLIGVPWRVTIGSKKLGRGLVEIYERATKIVREVPLTEFSAFLRDAPAATPQTAGGR
jgi:prolyl-tRNA synthetase